MQRDLALLSITLLIILAGLSQRPQPYDIAGLNKLASESLTRHEAQQINDIFNPKE